jgi:hypothetical protein
MNTQEFSHHRNTLLLLKIYNLLFLNSLYLLKLKLFPKETTRNKRQTPPTPPQETVERYPVNSGKLKKEEKENSNSLNQKTIVFLFLQQK